MDNSRERMQGISYQIVEQAQDGNANMQYQLANYLYMGDETKEPNKEQGFRWMLASAENGCIKAQKVLGLLYTSGQHTPWPEQDLSEAVYWYERAARAGDAEAMYWMFCCYNKGVGVLYDRTQADYWFEQAREHGYDFGDDAAPPEALRTERARVSREQEQDREGEKPWEQYDLEEEPGDRPSKRKGRTVRTSRDIRKKSLDMAQDGVIFTPKHDLAYAKSALTYGVIALSIAVIVCCLVALLVHAINHEFFSGSRKGIFIFVSAIVSLGLGAFAFRNAYLSAYEEAKRSAWFRQTPFYRQYKTDYERLTTGAQIQYEYYSALEKSFHPCAYTDVLPRGTFHEYRGYLFMGLIFGERMTNARPDFVIITEKSVYVIECMKLDRGSLIGHTEEAFWQHRTPSGRVRRIPNPILQNEGRLRIIEKDLANYCPWAVTAEVPFYSMVVIGTGVDTSRLDGIWRSERSHLLQASSEELRSAIEVIESKNTLHEEEALELTKAIEQIAQDYEKRNKTYSRENL